jgi:hypothetical protein
MLMSYSNCLRIVANIFRCRAACYRLLYYIQLTRFKDRTLIILEYACIATADLSSQSAVSHHLLLGCSTQTAVASLQSHDQ